LANSNFDIIHSALASNNYVPVSALALSHLAAKKLKEF
jgi:hypothetical protein